MACVKKKRQVIDDLDVYDPHDIFLPPDRVEKSQWHLNIDQNDNAIEIAENFHRDHNDRDKIINYFKQARKEDNPIPIIKAYTLDQDLTKRLNKHSAINTHHALKLYCTLLNCSTLAQTQEYTEAFTRIFFHPKLENFLVRKMGVHRGAVLEDEKFIANYKKGATIITTTFLFASTDRRVAEMFSEVPSGYMNMISVFYTYNINNTHRHTALNLKDISDRPHEKEVLILRYVPFKIRSVERKNDGRQIEICLDECPEQCTGEENRF